MDKINYSKKLKNSLRNKFMLYIILWILTIGALLSSYLMLYVNLQKIDIENPENILPSVKIKQLEDDKLNIPKVVESDKKFALSNKITNIAIFGLDERAEVYDGEWTRADSIMILTLDEKNKKIKLSSILRDCYVDVEEFGDIVKDKINHSFAFGASEEYEKSKNSNLAYHAGAMRSMKTLNNNFKMNIKDYVTINFSSFQNVIEKLGGVEINMTEEEVDEINDALGDYEVYGDFNKVSKGKGVKLLDGKQALAYARNRNIGGDQDRAVRQRIVIQAIYKKMKSVNPIQLTTVITELISMVKTNLTSMQILNLSSKVLFNDMAFVNTRFPSDFNWYADMIDGVSYDIITDEELNIIEMKKFIYNDILPESAEYQETTTAPQE